MLSTCQKSAENRTQKSCAVPRSAGPQRHGGGSGRKPFEYIRHRAFRHAGRVVRTAVLEFLFGIPSQQEAVLEYSCWISTLRLDILLELEKGLTESQSFQRRRYPTNPETQPLSGETLYPDSKC